MEMYRFEVLDPRPIPAAEEANDRVFSHPVYGIEVTVPALAKRCAFNLDPQHAGGDAGLTAIEVALSAELPPDGTVLATIRPDLDSVGAMAVLALRRSRDSIGFTDLLKRSERISTVAEADKFAQDGWPGSQPLPSQKNPWPSTTAGASDRQELAAIAAAVADFTVDIAVRVSTMERWLLTGEEPWQYRDRVEKERLDLINALETGQIKVETRYGGRIAIVESAHRAATMVGYAVAPVVVALNPAFRFGGGEPHQKFTICTFEAKYADIKAALAELAQLEPGWGGSPTIGGSPQGVGSTLTVEQVLEVVGKHLR